MKSVRPYSTGSKALIRDLNRSAVLNLVKYEGPISRVAISRRLGLSGAAVTSISGELEGAGLISEVAQAPSGGGRPAGLLGLNPGAAVVVGIKLAVDHLAAVMADLDGRVLGTDLVEMRTHDVDAVLERIGSSVERLRSMAGKARILGVGVGMPGVIDAASGRCVDSPILGWHDTPIADRLSQRLGLPVLVDNDVNTLAAAERLYGAGRDAVDFVAVTLGRGVGLGIVIGGQVYRGRLGGAGEFGHLPVEPDGPICECGRSGCLEALVADAALVSEARAAGVIGPDDEVEALVLAADGGNARARRIFEVAGERLGRAIAGLVNTLSPSLVIVSGEGMRARRHLEASLRTAVDQHVFPPLAAVELVFDPWDDAKWARGAAALVLESFFSAHRRDSPAVVRAADLVATAV